MFDSSARVLVVDDTQMLREILVKQLRELGFSAFVEVDDGEKAWTVLDHGAGQGIHFDILLVDSTMKKMHGVDLIRKLKQDSKFSSLAIVFVASVSEKSLHDEALQLGAHSVLIRPGTVLQLKHKLVETFAKVSEKKVASA